MSRTQKNKATEGHLGLLKARLAKLRTQLQEGGGGGAKKGEGEGFAVQRYGNGRVALVGFPSVGKSTLLTLLTGTESEAAGYEFTTLTCIPGIIHYKGSKIQLLDLPGIIEGAAQGKGRGREVIACAKSADLILMVLDALKPWSHYEILTREMESMGIRLNRSPPNIYFKKKKTGGLTINSVVPLTKMSDKTISQVLQVSPLPQRPLPRGDPARAPAECARCTPREPCGSLPRPPSPPRRNTRSTTASCSSGRTRRWTTSST